MKTVVSLPAYAGFPIAHHAVVLGGVLSTSPAQESTLTGKSLLGIAKEASLSKQGLELNVLQHGLVFDSLKFPTALLSIQLMQLINQTLRNLCSLNMMYRTPYVNTQH